MGLLDAKKISTQAHLDIEDIRDDMVVLKSGQVSIVIETASLNFELLDAQEQDARIYSFASLLTSIRFPIQIVIRTQKTDIARYQRLLESYKMKASTEAVVSQVNLYQDFINRLTQTAQILHKRFFFVIPSVKLPVITTSWLKQLFGKPQRIVNINQLLEKSKEELYPKRDHVLKQFANLGVKARQLENDELIKLYYSVYEPDVQGLDIMNISGEDLEQGIITAK